MPGRLSRVPHASLEARLVGVLRAPSAVMAVEIRRGVREAMVADRKKEPLRARRSEPEAWSRDHGQVLLTPVADIAAVPWP